MMFLGVIHLYRVNAILFRLQIWGRVTSWALVLPTSRYLPLR
jgi:hypothetical protein